MRAFSLLQITFQLQMQFCGLFGLAFKSNEYILSKFLILNIREKLKKETVDKHWKKIKVFLVLFLFQGKFIVLIHEHKMVKIQ